jgi:diaminopimelate decarboxylase
MQSTDYFKKNYQLISNIIANTNTPVFITDEVSLKEKVESIKSILDNKYLLFFAIKANFNPNIVSILKDSGVDGIETISTYEIELAKKLNFHNSQILFTGNNSDPYELDLANKMDVKVNIGSNLELEFYTSKYKNCEIFIRINPGFGDGEFQQIVTGGNKSKFGIGHNDVDNALKIIHSNNARLVGLHCHLGSGLYNTDNFEPMVQYMFNLANEIDTIQFIDVGGGIGVRYKPSEKPVNFKDFAKVIEKYYHNYDNLKKRNVKVILEPGKYLVAESTFLVTKITNIRQTIDRKTIAVDTGFNHIIRPALYGSYHHIINLSKLHQQEQEEVRVVGNICESTDVINEKISICKPENGDILAILTAGAYCASMSSLYNLRPYAAEALINPDQKDYLITRKRKDFSSTFDSLGFTTKLTQ